MFSNNILLIIFIIGTILLYLTNKKLTEPYLNFPSIYWPLIYKYGQSNLFNTNIVDENENTLFTAHPNKLVCSHVQNEMMKHARLSGSGGVMYISYDKPTDSSKCRKVSCPKLVVDGITPKELDHYNPFPLRRDKLTCWRCD